jgi:hypothetical protein
MFKPKLNPQLGLIERTRSKRILELSTIIKNFSSYSTWLENSACQQGEDADDVQRYQCATIRYGLFQAALNKDFAMLANQPAKVSESFSECVKSLLCIDRAEQDDESSAGSQASAVQHHPDCDCRTFKHAIIELYLPTNRQIKELDGLAHFNEQDGQGIVSLYGDELFGSQLHPANGLFDESDIPSAEQLAHHGEIALQQKITKKCKQEKVDNVQDAAIEAAVDRIESRRSSDGLFVSENAGDAGGTVDIATVTGGAITVATKPMAAKPTGTNLTTAIPAQPTNPTDNISDDPNFDTALYDLDSAWETNSTCSTEPDEEYFSDFNQVEAYRQLRGVDEQTLRSKKRKVIDLVSDPESVESLKERKKKKKKDKRSRKNKDDE